jgi:hypothetical protein
VRAAKNALEWEKSKVICTMPFLWIAIDDEPGAKSCRGYTERNAIALLSNSRRSLSIRRLPVGSGILRSGKGAQVGHRNR